MKLINLDHSPYASRVRIQVRHKGLELPFVPPAIPLRTPEYAAAYPLAKAPVLELDDGSHLSESTVIMDYLEDLFPEPALRPREPLARAQNAMLVRCADTHLGPALFPLFGELLAPSGDAADLALKFAALEKELGKLQNLLAYLPAFTGRSLQTGDIALAPTVYYIDRIGAAFDRPQLLAACPGIEAWRDWLAQYEAVIRTLDEMGAALDGFLTKSGGAS